MLLAGSPANLLASSFIDNPDDIDKRSADASGDALRADALRAAVKELARVITDAGIELAHEGDFGHAEECADALHDLMRVWAKLTRKEADTSNGQGGEP